MRDGFARTAPLAWGFWGGAVDDSDESPHHAAARELYEELCVDATPSDFDLLAQRCGSDGKVAMLLRYRNPLHWKDIEICEGAGAAFFWRSELEKLPVVKAVSWYLKKHPDFFPDHQEGVTAGAE